LSPKSILRALEEGEFLRAARGFLGHIFFHVNAVHLLLNLAAVIGLGAIVYREMEARTVERKSDAGTAFLAFFLISGMAAAMAFVLASPESYQPMIGSSGSAAGLAGACAWIFVTRSAVGRPRPGGVRNGLALVFISAALIGLSIYLDTSPISRRLFGTISAWQAHVGGYVFGVLAYPLFERMAGPGRR
ncbi:MAG: rhomboid family intramembrane serine protease, partial [Oricola sp.]|nr:rhomboid family intramembrane serine protease [Oricola sp.]